MAETVILFLTGLVGGGFGSLVGLGGAVIMLPVVQMVLHYRPDMAVGTTLFAVIFTSLSSSWGHFRAGNIQLKTGMCVGAGGILGTFIGSYVFKEYLAQSVNLLMAVLGTFYVFTACRIGRSAYNEWRQQRGYVQAKKAAAVAGKPSAGGLMLLGLVTGVVSSILGIGGGFIMMPLLIMIFGLSPYAAVGTSFLAMLPIALSGGLIKLYQGYVYLQAGLIMGAGTAIGAQLGVYISRFISVRNAKITFTVCFFLIGVRSISGAF